MWIKHPRTGKPDTALTLFVAGFVLACIKLVVSGLTIGSVTLAPFTGGDFAAVVGALGAVYAARKHSDKNNAS